jgi:hypothetical protein
MSMVIEEYWRLRSRAIFDGGSPLWRRYADREKHTYSWFNSAAQESAAPIEMRSANGIWNPIRPRRLAI